jgi:cytochrome b involved in lipid metabolism
MASHLWRPFYEEHAFATSPSSPQQTSIPSKHGFTLDEVASHIAEMDLYLVLDGQVYDISLFIYDHPCVTPVLA